MKIFFSLCCNFLLIVSLAYSKPLPVDITYIAVDLKYDDHGNLKILEFQDGPTAGFRAYDEVFTKGKIWKSFWDYLERLQKPVWYIGPRPRQFPEGVFNHDDIKRVAFNYFLKRNGHYSSNLWSLPQQPAFQELCNVTPQSKFLNYKKIEDYRGIMMFKQYGTPASERILFEREYPGFLFLNQRVRKTGIGINKKAVHSLFLDERLVKYRPRSHLYTKGYTPTLANQIIKDLKSQLFVIKPLFTSRSNGIIMTDQFSLDQVLQRMFVDVPAKTSKFKPVKDVEKPLYDYWKKDKGEKFLVEEYVPSKTIVVNDKPYDPTMRVVCVLSSSDDKIAIDFLAAFWKIPQYSLKNDASLTQAHVSHYRDDLAMLSAAALTVEPADLAQVQNLLTEALSIMYLKILENS